MTTLFGTISAAGTVTESETDKAHSPECFVHISGTWGGTTVSLQFYGLDGAWHSMGADFDWTTGSINKRVIGSKRYRLVAVGGTGIDLYWELKSS